MDDFNQSDNNLMFLQPVLYCSTENKNVFLTKFQA